MGEVVPQRDYHQNANGDSMSHGNHFQRHGQLTQPSPPHNSFNNQPPSSMTMPPAPQNNSNTQMYPLQPPRQQYQPNRHPQNNKYSGVDNSRTTNNSGNSNSNNATATATVVNRSHSPYDCVDPSSINQGGFHANNATLDTNRSSHNDNTGTGFNKMSSPQHRVDPSSADYY